MTCRRETNYMLFFFSYYYRALACSHSPSTNSIPPTHDSHELTLSALLCCADLANHLRKPARIRSGKWTISVVDSRTVRLLFVRLPTHHYDMDGLPLGLRNRADPLADASDPLSEEVEQVRNWQEGCSDPSQDGRYMVHPEVLVHWYGDNHHASCYHVADQGDCHQRRRSIFREGLDDVHVD